jgi:hypothetical protein
MYPPAPLSRETILLSPVVEIPLQAAALLIPRGDDPFARFLDFRQLPAHLDPQPGDLDRQSSRADHTLQQVRSLAQRLVVNQGGERQIAAAHRRAGSIVLLPPLDHATVPST